MGGAGKGHARSARYARSARTSWAETAPARAPARPAGPARTPAAVPSGRLSSRPGWAVRRAAAGRGRRRAVRRQADLRQGRGGLGSRARRRPLGIIRPAARAGPLAPLAAAARAVCTASSRAALSGRGGPTDRGPDCAAGHNMPRARASRRVSWGDAPRFMGVRRATAAAGRAPLPCNQTTAGPGCRAAARVRRRARSRGSRGPRLPPIRTPSGPSPAAKASPLWGSTSRRPPATQAAGRRLTIGGSSLRPAAVLARRSGAAPAARHAPARAREREREPGRRGT